MIGDRLDTDIVFGNSNGLDTLLVMTGVSKFEDLDKLETEIEAISGTTVSGNESGAHRGQSEAIKHLMPKIWVNLGTLRNSGITAMFQANSVADLLVDASATN